MKHIFLGKIIEKVYFLGYYKHMYGRFEKIQLNWDDPDTNISGDIAYEQVFKEYETISTTDELLRELDANESVWIENAEHYVNSKSYGLSGEVVYILKTQRVIKNEESLKEANSNLEKRKIFIDEQNEKILDDLAPLHKPIDNRKWYQKVFNV